MRHANQPTAPRRPLNPLLLRRVDRSGQKKLMLALVAGFPYYTHFYDTLREERVRATPLMIARLKTLARAIQFPEDEIFLDEVTR